MGFGGRFSICRRWSKNSNPSPKVADCFLPEDIMICILTRLPVKSILRFKSVCKRWRHLLSTQDFMKMHAIQFSSDPKNQSFVVHEINKNYSNTISLFNIESNEKNPTILTPHPLSDVNVEIKIVGCCYGLICIRQGQTFVLWNPALNLSKSVCPKLEHCGIGKMVSLGFGYDAVAADFKVVRILCERKGREKVSVGAEVYSANSDSWTAITLDFLFSVFRPKSDVIVNGNPYWVAKVYENKVLVCFDVTKLVFKIVPMSTLFYEKDDEVKFVDRYGSLAALVCTMRNKRVESLDIWVFDDCEQVWRKNHTFGPIGKNGRILGQRPDRKLIVFHSESETKWVRFLSFTVVVEGQFSGVHRYSESLAYIEGMEKVELRRQTRKMIDDLDLSN